MNKRKKWGIIALVICVIGGIVMFSLNHQKEKTLEEKMRIEQDRMVLYLVNHYEGINEIESYSNNPADIKDMVIRPSLPNKLNKLRSNLPEAYYYWAKTSELLEA